MTKQKLVKDEWGRWVETKTRRGGMVRMLLKPSVKWRNILKDIDDEQKLIRAKAADLLLEYEQETDPLKKIDLLKEIMGGCNDAIECNTNI